MADDRDRVEFKATTPNDELELTIKLVDNAPEQYRYKRFYSWSEWARDKNKYGRIYVWIKGESILGNLLNRRSRPYNYYKTEIIPTALRALGIDPAKKVNWSQKAGCSCPCSPGFIAKDIPQFRGKSVHIDVA